MLSLPVHVGTCGSLCPLQGPSTEEDRFQSITKFLNETEEYLNKLAAKVGGSASPASMASCLVPCAACSRCGALSGAIHELEARVLRCPVAGICVACAAQAPTQVSTWITPHQPMHVNHCCCAHAQVTMVKVAQEAEEYVRQAMEEARRAGAFWAGTWEDYGWSWQERLTSQL